MSPSDIDKINDLEELLDNDELEGFEKSFTETCVSYRDTNRDLSQKQLDKLDEVWDRHFGRDI